MRLEERHSLLTFSAHQTADYGNILESIQRLHPFDESATDGLRLETGAAISARRERVRMVAPIGTNVQQRSGGVVPEYSLVDVTYLSVLRPVPIRRGTPGIVAGRWMRVRRIDWHHIRHTSHPAPPQKAASEIGRVQKCVAQIAEPPIAARIQHQLTEALLECIQGYLNHTGLKHSPGEPPRMRLQRSGPRRDIPPDTSCP